MAHTAAGTMIEMPPGMEMGAEAAKGSGMGMMGSGMGMMDGGMEMGAGMGMMDRCMEMMGGGMEMGSGMGMMGSGMNMMGGGMGMGPGAAATVAAGGAMMSATTRTGTRLVKRLLKNPWVLIGIGVVAGVLVHKYRREIITSASRVAGKGKDFVLQQKESLEDLAAESREAEEQAGKKET